MANDDHSQDEHEMPAVVQKNVLLIKALHEEREKTMADYLAERAQLEAKYQSLFKPLYERRADVVAGRVKGDADADNNDDVKGIPQFWVLAMAQMDEVGDILTEEDISCLESLQDIQCLDNETGDGFTLMFHFSPNDYFENSVLTKKYDVPNLLLGSEPVLKNVEGCDIRWKDGKCLTFSEVTQMQRGKGKNKGQVRSVVKTERKDSFFHFFTPPKLPNLECMDEDEALRLEAEFNMDYDVAQAFRSQIVPKAFLWYTGTGNELEMEAAMDEVEWPKGQEPADQ
jgi:nucleosome assembly protein 1-like 1